MLKKRLGVIFILVLAFAGIADAAYLAQHALSNMPLICNIADLSGCNIVAQSPYAHLFGIPLGEYGILFYGIVFALALLELVLFDRFLRRALQGVALIGLLCSVAFEGIQIFLIHALCVYCLGSALVSLLIFLCATMIEPLKRQEIPTVTDESSPRPRLTMPPAA